MIKYLLSLWPRCAVMGRRGACVRPWFHTGRHKYPSKTARLLSLSIERAKAAKETA
jgi:hypothetical protein